jgi:hypothetical protein
MALLCSFFDREIAKKWTKVSRKCEKGSINTMLIIFNKMIAFKKYAASFDFLLSEYHQFAENVSAGRGLTLTSHMSTSLKSPGLSGLVTYIIDIYIKK